MKNNEIYIKHQELTEKIYFSENMLPSRYVLVLSNLCNLKCPFCYQEKKYSPTNMSKEQWIHLIKQFPSYSRVTLTGGEPFLFKGFKEVFKEVAQRFDCNIISNGVLLTKELIDFLLSFKNFKTLSISVDTIKNTNRKISQKDWENVEEMLAYFIKKREELNPLCKLDIKSTVLDENIPDLFQIHKYCVEELKADYHSFQLLKGSPLQHADIEYKYEDIFKEYSAYKYKEFDTLKEQLTLVRKYNQQNNQIGFLHPKVTSLLKESFQDYSYINNTSHNKELFQNCKFPWSSVHINYDGKVFPCLAINMGNVKEKPLKEIIFSNKFNQFKSDIKKNKTVSACNRCGWLKPTCEVE
ncbi:hypothetical protein CRV00_09235 [Malaciobacter molluscorum]|uniref:radical SAM protein n=1 Tax=Malaciobacter molluscorum TaxID=1032072 RepID=UPI00100B5B1D|nr:radical SAM protein [Malaciobacter molluscorum]RXJ93843.1 hypothetical protein CRV00_09235 [Malaciobacter molluscorum]